MKDLKKKDSEGEFVTLVSDIKESTKNQRSEIAISPPNLMASAKPPLLACEMAIGSGTRFISGPGLIVGGCGGRVSSSVATIDAIKK